MVDMIIYNEPVPGIDPQGQVMTANRKIVMTNRDAIAVQRGVVTARKGVCDWSDEDLLDEFMIIHWAEVKR